MTDRVLLEGIGSLHELTSLRLIRGCNLTAQALSTFLHRPSMNSIVLLELSCCYNLDDEGLKGIATRCIFTCPNVVVCLKHEVLVSVWLWRQFIIVFYLQVHTFERIGGFWVLLCNWCWNQHVDTLLQSVAPTGFDGSTVHYRYVCTLWRHWTYIAFYNTMVYGIPTAGSSLTTKTHHRTILWASILLLISS